MTNPHFSVLLCCAIDVDYHGTNLSRPLLATVSRRPHGTVDIVVGDGIKVEEGKEEGFSSTRWSGKDMILQQIASTLDGFLHFACCFQFSGLVQKQ